MSLSLRQKSKEILFFSLPAITTGIIHHVLLSHGLVMDFTSRVLMTGSATPWPCDKISLTWPTRGGSWRISLVLCRIPYLPSIFLGKALYSKINEDFISCNCLLFVFPLPPHALLSSQQSSRCGFRTEEPNSAGTREPCWPIKTLPSSNPTQEM